MKNALLTLLGIVTSVCLCTGELAAWQRKPVDTARCQREQKTIERCTKETAEDNEYNFTALLSPNSYKIYEDFTPQQQQSAMDYADGNQMDPNDAVAKVARQSKRS